MSLARILNKARGRPSFITDNRWVLPSSFIGLEHEYEGVKDPIIPKHTFGDLWEHHDEPSLKDYGAEYVFAAPMFGVDAYNAIEWLVNYAKDSKWKCTKRTGIHVHLDVRDLTVNQLAGLSIIYAAVEPVLYHWIGDGRDVSHFCMPLYHADEALLGACSIIRSALQDERTDGHAALEIASKYQRYAGFNLQALQKFGSIEFRQLQTTHDLTRIIDWINMLMSLKVTALKLPQSDGAVVRMIQRLGARELLNYIFPAELAAKLYTLESQKEFLVKGLPSARDIAVHGCGNASWVNKDFPKGVHKGFTRWLKETKTTGNAVQENEDLPEGLNRVAWPDLEGGDEPEPDPELQRDAVAMNFNVEEAMRGIPRALGGYDLLFQQALNIPAPPAPLQPFVQPAPQFHIFDDVEPIRVRPFRPGRQYMAQPPAAPPPRIRGR